MSQVIACIDASRIAVAVCDYAVWAAQTLGAPLEFLHVLPRQPTPTAPDLSGSIGLGSQETLLRELALLDEKRGRLAMEQGKHLLDAAKQRALNAGMASVTSRQRHGELIDTLRGLEDEIRLLVMGREGEDGERLGEHIGSHLENTVRTLHRPILVVPAHFASPTKVMVAFDGSGTSRKAIELVAASPLLAGLPIHVVQVGQDKPDIRAGLDWAQTRLIMSGFNAQACLIEGGVEQALCGYRAEQGIDLMVMGAYGHSRIREFLVGSTTAKLIRLSKIPLVLLR